MTNKEFYNDKLLAVALENACGRLHRAVYGESCLDKKKCEDCEFYTVENIEKWLNAEHVEPEPPLLENGDGLQPDDWIMVRDKDSEPWVKRRFLVYCNGLFYCVDGGFGINKSFYVYGWRQARLPEDGE